EIASPKKGGSTFVPAKHFNLQGHARLARCPGDGGRADGRASVLERPRLGRPTVVGQRAQQGIGGAPSLPAASMNTHFRIGRLTDDRVTLFEPQVHSSSVPR